MSTNQPESEQPRLHPDTASLVKRFAAALAEKLFHAQEKYGYSDGWKKDDWVNECRFQLAEHVLKGDPRDVAAYCAFCWHHGWKTAHLVGQTLEETFFKPNNDQQSTLGADEEIVRIADKWSTGHGLRGDFFTKGARRETITDALKELAALLAQAHANEREAAREEGVKSVILIRCTKHLTVAQQNSAEFTGSECGGCIAEERDKWKDAADHFDKLHEIAELWWHCSICGEEIGEEESGNWFHKYRSGGPTHHDHEPDPVPSHESLRAQLSALQAELATAQNKLRDANVMIGWWECQMHGRSDKKCNCGSATSFNLYQVECQSLRSQLTEAQDAGRDLNAAAMLWERKFKDANAKLAEAEKVLSVLVESVELANVRQSSRNPNASFIDTRDWCGSIKTHAITGRELLARLGGSK